MPPARALRGLLVTGSFALLAAGGTPRLAAGAVDLRSLLPASEQLPGWRVADPPRVFQGDGLFDLIDGGAMLYQEYGFVEAAACRYAGAGTASLQVEIYRMSSDQAAYGIYSMTQSAKGVAVDIGQAARLFDDYVALWKGPFYVSVTALGPREVVGNALLDAGRLIAARITETGRTPELIGRLPRNGLLDQKYLRGNLALSNIHVFGPDDPFRVKEGVCGFYPDRLEFIFRYATTGQAAAQVAAARQALAETGSYRTQTTSANGFDGADGERNRISVRQEADCIRVRLDLATPARTP